MNPNQDPRLEARITRELKSLGDLPAPAGLDSRVLRAIKAREAAPWYRRAWQTWPVELQTATIVALVAVFAGICYLGGGVSQSASDAVATQRQSGWFAQLGFIWNLFSALGQSLAAIVNHIGKGVVVSLVLLAGTMWAACVGVGSAYVRFALNVGRRENL